MVISPSFSEVGDNKVPAQWRLPRAGAHPTEEEAPGWGMAVTANSFPQAAAALTLGDKLPRMREMQPNALLLPELGQFFVGH